MIASFNKAEEALNEGNLWTSEIHSIKSLHALDQIRTKLLVIHVNAYLKLGEFRKAHYNVRSIQETAILEDLSMEEVDIMKKRYHDAITMFNSAGLFIKFTNYHLPSDYCGYALLTRNPMEKPAEYRQVDVIKKLPHEIRTLILDQRDFIDILNCIHVSKDWRLCILDDTESIRQHVILDYETRERNVSFSSEFYKSPMTLLSDGVKSLKIDGGIIEEEKTEMYDILRSVSFNYLRVLTIGNLKNILFLLSLNKRVHIIILKLLVK